MIIQIRMKATKEPCHIVCTGHLPEAELRKLLVKMAEDEPSRNILIVKDGVDFFVPIRQLDFTEVEDGKT